jgi:hypothetical protein
LQLSKPAEALAKLLPLVNGIRHTYRNRNELQTEMIEPLMSLAYLYNRLKEPEKALEAIKEISDSFGPQLMYMYIPALHALMAEVMCQKQ